MKKAFIYSLMVAALAVVSCTKTTLEPLKGVYPEAQQPVLTTLVSSSFEKTESSRIFYLQFSGEGGAAIKAALVGPRAQYYLEPGVYGPGEKNLCFITNGGKTTVNGQAVIDGQISVKKEDDTYRFVFILFDSAGTAYRTSWKGQLVYEPDPEPVTMLELYVAQANTNNTVTVKVGTPGLVLDMVGSPSGTGYLFTADLYSPDGYLHEGTYTAATSDVTGEGQFTPGYAYDLSEYGLGIAHWGTCWWVDGVARDLNSGTITVAQKGSKWVITWGEEATYPDWAVFEGEIEALTPSGGGDYDGVSLTQNFGIIDYVALYGMKMVGIEMGTSGVVATPGAWGNTYTGNGNYLKLEIYSEDGKIAPGTYKACTVGGEIGPGEFGIGYDGMFGASGTTWYTLVNDQPTYQYITDGTVTVEVDGDDYKITIESSVVKARYGYGEGGGGDVTADFNIVDTAVPGAMDSSWQTHEDVTTHYLTLTDAEGEEVAYFQLVLANEVTDLSGVYECKEYAHEDHTCGNGYDAGAYGIGGCRYYKDGSLVFITPGETVTITAVAEGIYKIEGEGYVFVGKIVTE